MDNKEMSKNELKLKVLWGDDIFSSEEQTKSFDCLESAITWCKRNYNKIHCINGYLTRGEVVPYFDLVCAIENKKEYYE